MEDQALSARQSYFELDGFGSSLTFLTPEYGLGRALLHQILLMALGGYNSIMINPTLIRFYVEGCTTIYVKTQITHFFPQVSGTAAAGREEMTYIVDRISEEVCSEWF